jgi:selenocysteine lyase/cysteine desulfurase
VIHPIQNITALAKKVGAKVLIDGAQGVVHLPVDVRALDCDFYAFGGHKVLGPTGTGVLYAKEDILESMPPYQFGGDMIETVTTEGSSWAGLPNKFEAGTPNIAGAIGLGVALEYMNQLPRADLLAHERRLGSRCLEALLQEGAQVFAKPGDDWVGIVSFYHEHMHPHDIASVCASEGVCIRAGHHCAQPLMHVLGVSASSRVSPFLYNNDDDIDRFIEAFKKARRLFA